MQSINYFIFSIILLCIDQTENLNQAEMLRNPFKPAHRWSEILIQLWLCKQRYTVNNQVSHVSCNCHNLEEEDRNQVKTQNRGIGIHVICLIDTVSDTAFRLHSVSTFSTWQFSICCHMNVDIPQKYWAETICCHQIHGIKHQLILVPRWRFDMNFTQPYNLTFYQQFTVPWNENYLEWDDFIPCWHLSTCHS